MVVRSTTETPAGMFSIAVGIRVAVTTMSGRGTSTTGGASSASAGANATAYSSMGAWMRRMRSSFIWDRTHIGGDPVTGTTAAYGSSTRRIGTPRPLHATV